MKLVNVDTTSDLKYSTSDKDNWLICSQDEAVEAESLLSLSSFDIGLGNSL